MFRSKDVLPEPRVELTADTRTFREELIIAALGGLVNRARPSADLHARLAIECADAVIARLER